MRWAGRAQRCPSCATNVGYVKRWLLLLLGIVLILLGISAASVSGSALALFGSDESVSTPTATVHANGAALLVENIRIDASSIPVPHGLGTLRLTVSSPNAASMFIGSAPASSVDTYLTGAPYDVVFDLTTEGKVTTRSVPGSQTPSPPESQSIWTQKASGAQASIPTTAGNHDTIVIMNSDASTGITADLGVSLTMPGIWRAGWIGLGLGLLSMIVGGVAIWRSVVARRHGKHSAHAPVVTSADVSGVPVTNPVSMQGAPEVVGAPEPALDASVVPAPYAPAPDLPAPALDAPTVNPPAVPTALDPMLIAPWTHVEQATSPSAATASEDVTPEAESGLSEPAVWESPEWIAPATTIDPASAPVSEAE